MKKNIVEVRLISSILIKRERENKLCCHGNEFFLSEAVGVQFFKSGREEGEFKLIKIWEDIRL